MMISRIEPGNNIKNSKYLLKGKLDPESELFKKFCEKNNLNKFEPKNVFKTIRFSNNCVMQINSTGTIRLHLNPQRERFDCIEQIREYLVAIGLTKNEAYDIFVKGFKCNLEALKKEQEINDLWFEISQIEGQQHQIYVNGSDDDEYDRLESLIDSLYEKLKKKQDPVKLNKILRKSDKTLENLSGLKKLQYEINHSNPKKLNMFTVARWAQTLENIIIDFEKGFKKQEGSE